MTTATLPAFHRPAIDAATLDLPNEFCSVTFGSLRIDVDVTADQDYDGFVDAPDAYGRIAWPNDCPRNDCGNRIRPKDFDGFARKIDTISGPVWWQPPTGISEAQARSEHGSVADLASFGWSIVTVNVRDDETGRVLASASCGACDEYRQDIGRELAAEALGQLWPVSLEGDH